jgi:zinc/manganese transport system substrate-binding protein
MFTTYQSEQAPGSLARALGWPVVQLQLEPQLDADGDDYLDHIDAWVRAAAGSD